MQKVLNLGQIAYCYQAFLALVAKFHLLFSTYGPKHFDHTLPVASGVLSLPSQYEPIQITLPKLPINADTKNDD